MPGVRIEDMGHKMGCNGVDNGKLWFDGAPCLRRCVCPDHNDPYLHMGMLRPSRSRNTHIRRYFEILGALPQGCAWSAGRC